MNMFRAKTFEPLLLENYSSFILTIECKEDFTLQGALSEHNQGKIAKKQREMYVFLHMSFLSFIFNKKLLLYKMKPLFQNDYIFMIFP